MIEEWKLFSSRDKAAFRGFDLEYGHSRADYEREEYVKTITKILKVIVFLLSVILLCFTGTMLWNNYWQAYQYTEDDLAEVKVEPSHLHIGVQLIKDVDEDAVLDILSVGPTKAPGDHHQQDSALSEIIKDVPLDVEDIKDLRSQLAKDLTEMEKDSQGNKFNTSQVDFGKLVKPLAEELNEKLSNKDKSMSSEGTTATSTAKVPSPDENFNSEQLKKTSSGVAAVKDEIESDSDKSYYEEYEYENNYDQPIFGQYEGGSLRHKSRDV